MSIDRYIAALHARLSSDEAEEVRGHLEDLAADLQRSGLDRAASESEAMRRFGDAGEVIAALAAEAMAARRQRRLRQARRSAAALLVAAALAVVGGNAVASAYTVSGRGHHVAPIMQPGHARAQWAHGEGRP